MPSSEPQEYRAHARYDHDQLAWTIQVEGVPGVVEECTAASVRDAARAHVARELGLPMDAVDVVVECDGPDTAFR